MAAEEIACSPPSVHDELIEIDQIVSSLVDLLKRSFIILLCKIQRREGGNAVFSVNLTFGFFIKALQFVRGSENCFGSLLRARCPCL